ncbi:ribonuclease P subunit P29 [Exophiala viscosa]|uniref:Ribonuclease P protein subunit n=1 Tax=Exophiala viscosa TaxID=2486360 RepID=A0AAN6E1S8_9EURO|nr:ribonuclease P subunit P29 [Exophiala viscosa]KAI1624039.1 ribonuclease P subunit P29 [Exophiala viscosa]
MTSSPRPTAATTSAPPISHPAHTLLARAHSPDTSARIFTDKVKNKPLLLEPTAGSDKRALRRHIRLRKKEYYLRKRKPRPLSAKEKRVLGVFKLQKSEIKYDIYKNLHDLWNGYMLEVLGFTTPPAKDGNTPTKRSPTVTAQSHGILLASADFHGAELEVVRCGDAGKVGIKGIVVRDTQYTFVVVTPKDEVKTLPKRDTVFRYEVAVAEEKRLVFEVHGNQFEFRPVDRANRKFKWKVMDYL